MCEKYYSISPYAYCAGNPVNRIDPTGMVIDSTSQTQWNEQKQAVQNEIASLVKNNTNDENDDRIASLQGSLTNMETLENSDQVYSLAAASCDEGQVKLDVSTGKIVIEFKGTANFVHEVTHGAQYESGEIGFNKNTGRVVGQDLWDEASAYKAQYNYNPSSIRTVNNASEITPLWVQGITDSFGKNPYAPGGRANTGGSPLNANSGGAAVIYAYPAQLSLGFFMLMHNIKLSDFSNYKFNGR